MNERSSNRDPGRATLRGRRRARFDRDVAPGVHRLAHACTNAYLIEDGDAITLVDALFPASIRHLHTALRAIGREPGDVRALILTHGHFDHLGMADALADAGLPIWVHPLDARLAAHPYRYRPARPRFAYPFRYPGSLTILGAMASVGALSVRGVRGTLDLVAGETVDVPGSPRVIATPGHTDGHVSLLLQDRDAVLSGDALVTLDPYTAKTGPRVVAAAATNDPRAALESLELLEATGVDAVLPGHGEPWMGGVGSAVAAARAAGID